MTTRYLAFDLETAKQIPEGDFDLHKHRPLGIACAATLTSDTRETRLWHGKTSGGTPSPQMTPMELRSLVDYLAEMTADGYTILTWNGLAFDFDIMAEESGDLARCASLADSHVDMMFHAFCSLGYRIGLDKAARGMGLPGKPPGMTGAKAPKMWAEGRYEEVLKYVGHDVEIAVSVAETASRQGRLSWITGSGAKRNFPLAGWLTVQGAMNLPLPDTSWMTSPATREEFIHWLSPGR